jgi:hypothetical protein
MNESTLKVNALAVPGAAAHMKSLPGLACGQELALGPVTHQLKACLALDEHGRGQVPVAAWGAGSV